MPRIITSLSEEFIDVISHGGIAVIRTDTLYGIVASAGNQSAVNKVYTAKNRDPSKSPIVLIGSVSDVYDPIDDNQRATLDIMWPGPYSIILPSSHGPRWILRNNQSIAYRVPAVDELRLCLMKTGPLIAPSANTEGETPARSIQQAVEYFGENVDLYVDGGEIVDTRPSTLLRFDGAMFEKLR